MAAWIRVSAKTIDMGVVKRCADALRIPRAHALGLLTALWAWVADQGDDGDLTALSDRDIERAVGWNGEDGAFAAFVREKHTDRRGRINEWDEYMGPMVRARRSARERQRNHRERLRAQQDADADSAIGGGGRNGNRPAASSDSDPVTRDTGGRFTITRDAPDVTRDRSDIRRDSTDVTSDRRTEVELRKSLRTTGMYLGRELELVSSEGLDERAIKSSSSNTQTYREPSQLQGVELVREFAAQFYRTNRVAMLVALQTLRAVLRPAGVVRDGKTIRATPELLVRAMREVLARPPREPFAATTVVLKKLESGHLHEVTTDDGVLVTEARAQETRRLDGETTSALLGIIPDAFGSIGRSMPGSKHVNPRGAWPTGATDPPNPYPH